MPDPPDHHPDPASAEHLDLRLVREFDNRSSLWLFEDPEHLRGLLQILDPPLVERLDFAHARRINRSFVPADLQEKESDLVYAVPFRQAGGTEVWVYVLLEHQSEPDPEMGLRLFLYMGEMWDTQRREWQDRKLPLSQRRLLPIIPVVYYTGEKQWSAPLGLKHLMDLPAELERFVPEWETLFLNLRETPPEALTRFASAVGWALRVLREESAPLAEMERVLKAAMAGLEGLTEEQSGQWLRVAWFIFALVSHRRGERALADLVLEEAHQSKFSARERITTMGLSIVEQLKEEGRAEGRAEALSIAEQLKEEGRAEGRAEVLSIAEQLKEEGRAEGRAEVLSIAEQRRTEGAAQEARRFLLRQLRERFGELPDAVLAWVESADREACEALGVRLLRAGSLAELGFSEANGGPARNEERGTRNEE